MEKEENRKPKELTKELIYKLIFCLGLSLFWVIFLWGFWSKGIFVFGINAFIFLALFTILFLWVLYKKQKFSKIDLVWIIPIFFIESSFLIYENPFLKIVSFVILPALFAIFYNQTLITNKKINWNFNFITLLLLRILSAISEISRSVNLYFRLLTPNSKSKKTVIVKSIIGLALFLIIALTIIIPLLSSADLEFANRMENVVEWFRKLVSETIVIKLMFFIALSVVILSMLLAWSKKFDYKEQESKKDKIDPIITGIFLGGILVIYLLFLWVQLERMWVGSLPFDFKETESLVKSGFWQLFFLSILNILIYFFTYRKTNTIVQRILTGFTITSLLLLISAGHRMALYVLYYGFSYEKFFASYTVLFCVILFIWLIFSLLRNKKSNILKFLIVLFLWMYSIIAVLPVEQFILRTNMSLVKLEDSQIRLFELTMLSADVLPLVKKYEKEGLLKENVDYIYRENNTKENGENEEFDWSPWIRKQEKRIFDKELYEMNIFNILYLYNSY